MMIELNTQFSCAHFYNQTQWSEKQNSDTFGKCFDPHGHGHDYKLYVTVDNKFESSLKTSLVALKEHLDHHHLNYWVETFKTEIPTTENLAKYCWNFLKKQSPELEIKSLKLFETDTIWSSLTS